MYMYIEPNLISTARISEIIRGAKKVEMVECNREFNIYQRLY